MKSLARNAGPFVGPLAFSMLVCSLLVLPLLAGCGARDGEHRDTHARDGRDDRRDARAGQAAGQRTGQVAAADLRPSQQATTRPALSNVTGTITFTELQGERIHVTGEVRGLTPNSEHGFHIHEKGDLSAPDFTSAGAHFNPEGERHGGLHTDRRHVGDLGNIRSNAKGVARVDLIMENATLQGRNAIVGRSLLVHAGRDDLKTDPSGESGDRIAGGTIEMRRGMQQGQQQGQQQPR